MVTSNTVRGWYDRIGTEVFSKTDSRDMLNYIFLLERCVGRLVCILDTETFNRLGKNTDREAFLAALAQTRFRFGYKDFEYHDEWEYLVDFDKGL